MCQVFMVIGINLLQYLISEPNIFLQLSLAYVSLESEEDFVIMIAFNSTNDKPWRPDIFKNRKKTLDIVNLTNSN